MSLQKCNQRAKLLPNTLCNKFRQKVLAEWTTKEFYNQERVQDKEITTLKLSKNDWLEKSLFLISTNPLHEK